MNTTPTRRYTALVRDLVLPARIGIYPGERNQTQSVRISLEAEIDQPPPLNDRIADVYNYEQAITGIRAIVSAGHVNLVETLAERIAAMMLGDARVASITVTVEKPEVYAEAAAVGVRIHRTRTPET